MKNLILNSSDNMTFEEKLIYNTTESILIIGRLTGELQVKDTLIDDLRRENKRLQDAKLKDILTKKDGTI